MMYLPGSFRTADLSPELLYSSSDPLQIRGAIMICRRCLPGCSVDHCRANRQPIVPRLLPLNRRRYVLDRALFNDLKRHAEFFCHYDDYNWDWSVIHCPDDACSLNVL